MKLIASDGSYSLYQMGSFDFPLKFQIYLQSDAADYRDDGLIYVAGFQSLDKALHYLENSLH